MRVGEVMTRFVRTVPPAIPAYEAWEMMRRYKVRHLVVHDGTSVLGVLSDRDAGGRRGAAVRAQSLVQDLMTPGAVSVQRDETVRRAANLMRGRSIGCLPVLAGHRLVGIVTVSDLLELLGRGADRGAAAERRGLHHRVPHRKRKTATPVW